ncbi:hypothetical protein [Roseomonas mucosa]|uniref:hypothetical protein n=1 Tax=Roseomonas mucosa TaxID=207340 RepID=UPI001D9F7E23|nr:hypothetical protein [Roseomonas mucosa]MBS5905411.1 hypothetical protein [Acetobacteraceae bacterium]MCG7353543.1 hypothetical protein [Roseomonas mucosa]MCG7358896.1 hypothetical protein [Roseomonas mucosa]
MPETTVNPAVSGVPFGRRSPLQQGSYSMPIHIRAALEAAGVEFIPENGGGAGVRLRKQSS